MKKSEKQAIGFIRYLAFDKRSRALKEDNSKWLQEKMKYIKKAVRYLPHEDFDFSEKSLKKIIDELKKAKKEEVKELWAKHVWKTILKRK